MTRIHPIEKIRLIDWLASPRGPRPAAYLRKFRPRMSVRFALAVRSTLSGRPAGPRRFESLYLPSTPFVKVVALRHYAKIFGPRVFVETGTFLGDTTAAVADLFERCYTIELSPELHARARKRLSLVPQVICVEGKSEIELPRLLQRIAEPALFWLDAHGSAGITADAGLDPVLHELDAIYRHAIKRHVILVDDARGHQETVWRRVPAGYRASVRNDIIRIVPG
jgi:hypothetical protein